MYKIMLIEDDKVIASTLKQTLEQWGLKAFEVQDFKNVLSEFIASEPHLVILDISLPYFSGYHWCSEIRKLSKVPIVFLSSASDNLNMVMAMNLGADDFIAKPFDLMVFVAKIQALIRRTYAFNGQASCLEYKGVFLNLANATLTYENSTLDLTKNDFKILQILMENPGNIVSRSDIMTRLWDSDSFIDENTLTVNVTRIRKKLEEIGLKDFIQTKKGIGYMVTDDVK